MSWSYSPVLVAEFLEVNCSVTEQSQPLSMTPTPDQFYSHGKPTESCRLSQFGMTFEPLTDGLGGELLTWYRAGFHAKTYPSQEKAQDLTESDQDCGEKWRGWLAKFDPVTCSWRTAQLSLLGDSEGFSVTLPRSGMTRGGLLWGLPTLAHPTRETDFGFWPTPCKSDGLIGWNETVTRNRELTGMRPSGARIGYQLNYVRQTQPYVMKSGIYHPNLSEWLMGWPLEWSELQPLETAKSRNAAPQPGKLLEAHE